MDGKVPCQWLRSSHPLRHRCKRICTCLFPSLSIRFPLQGGTIWVIPKIYDPITSLLSMTMHENSVLADNGSSMWEPDVGKYMVYGRPESWPNISTDIRTHPAVRVKIEHGIHIVVNLFDFSHGDEPTDSTPIVEPSQSSLRPPSMTPLLYALIRCVLLHHPLPNPPFPFFNVDIVFFPCRVGKTSSRS